MSEQVHDFRTLLMDYHYCKREYDRFNNSTHASNSNGDHVYNGDPANHRFTVTYMVLSDRVADTFYAFDLCPNTYTSIFIFFIAFFKRGVNYYYGLALFWNINNRMHLLLRQIILEVRKKHNYSI